jgi:penicillin G amidase
MCKSGPRKTVLSTPSRALLGCILMLVVCVAVVPVLVGQQNPAATESFVLPHLQQPVEILIDHWGVPHIYAKNEADLFFAQGFSAARDRLFQMDLWRRRGLGQLAEAFGPAFVEQDTATRLFIYRGDMKKEWAVYSPDSEQIAQNFTAGINAYIDWLDQNPGQLSFEFKKLSYKPARWAAEDVVRIRSHGLSGNLTSEVARAKVVCAADLKSDEIRSKLDPPWQAHIPEGLDPCLPEDVLEMFTLATQEVRLTPDSQKALAIVPSAPLAADLGNRNLEASNNWVIDAKKSATGRAIMANDPHRNYTEPSIRYIADLNSPTLHLTGFGEPSVPGLSNGHNDWIAWGATFFDIDQEDLYVYDLNPSNPDQYKYRGQWEPFRVIHEEIRVKDHAAIPIDLKFTRHGPVIYVDHEKNRAFAVRTDWLEPGTSAYYSTISIMRDKTFDEFKKSVANWGTPPLNHVYADVKGNIGWSPRGFAPIRTNWDGLLPVPGDGSYEWAGHLKGDQLPEAYNPASGYITTSNHMDLPPDYPYKDRKLGFEWTPPFRHERIDEVLSKLNKVSIEDSMKLQADVVSIPARRLVALLQPLSSSDADTKAALSLLKGWNASIDADSPQAALHEVWFSRHLGDAFKHALLSKTAGDAFAAPDPEVLLDTLENPQTRFGQGAKQKSDQVLLESLGAAYREMKTLLGPDPKEWKWGKLHYNLSEHPFAAVVDAATRAKLNVGPIPTNGSAFTVNASRYRVSDFRQIGGPSVRWVVDVGNWDNTRAVNLPGQSGNPDSPHYRDLASMWRNGQYFPLLYSRKAVEGATEKKLTLVPAHGQP